MLTLFTYGRSGEGNTVSAPIRCGREAGGRDLEPFSLGAETRNNMRTAVGAEGLKGRIASLCEDWELTGGGGQFNHPEQRHQGY
jgi:hypothetical protein